MISQYMANDSGAVQWFTCTNLQQTEAKTQTRKKPRTLHVLHNWWLTRLTHMEDLTRTHLRTVTNHYQRDCVGMRVRPPNRPLNSPPIGPLIGAIVCTKSPPPPPPPYLPPP